MVVTPGVTDGEIWKARSAWAFGIFFAVTTTKSKASSSREMFGIVLIAVHVSVVVADMDVKLTLPGSPVD